MSKVYKSEAFIVPVSNRNAKNDNNVIDDVKISKIKNEETYKISEYTFNSNSDKNIIYEVGISAESSDHLTVIKNDHVDKDEETKIDDQKIKSNPEVIYDHVSFSYLKNKKLQSAEFHYQLAKKDDNKKNHNIINNNNSIYNVIDEPIYEVPYSSSNYKKSGYSKYRERFETAEYVTLKLLPKKNNNKYLLPKPLMRTSSLMSIDERGETPEDCIDELCYHGNKNGCTTTTKRPEAVTEEIFEINWMKRLEQLRARETVIKDKEIMLYDREKLLFKKEKELRILERLLKDKLKHAELCLKRKSQIIDSIDFNDIENKFSEFSKALSYSSKSGVSTKLSSTESLESCQQSDRILNELVSSEFAARTNFKTCGPSTTGINFSENKSMKNLPNSRSSLATVSIGSSQSQASRLENALSNSTNRNILPPSAYSSCRSKRRPKMTYDDLDSTLSADIGDSSLVITSRKFDPEIFKKPYILTKLSSERHPKIVNDKILECNYEDEKTIKRISDNIINSYDKNTKFQDYGLIDLRLTSEKKSNSGDDINKRHSYLDLEDGKKSKNSLRIKKNKKLSKDRPISWNEESNEWLQKKRQAYNLQTAKKMSTENFNNKENYSSYLKLGSNQTLRKNSKEKKFSIFR